MPRNRNLIVQVIRYSTSVTLECPKPSLTNLIYLSGNESCDDIGARMPVQANRHGTVKRARSCLKESESVRESWLALPIAWNRSLARSSNKRWTAQRTFPAEIDRIDRAVREAAAELGTLVEKVAQELGASAADIFKSHLQIVNDPELIAKVHGLIEKQHLTALSALQVVMQTYSAQFARMEQEFFRERMTDIRDVILRIESHLTRRWIGPTNAVR